METDFKQVPGTGLAGTVEQIDRMPISTAQKTIDDIANRKGDEFVKEILDHLPPVKIAAMLRQHDFSCPSIISWLLSSSAIVNILKVDPLFWKNIHDDHNPGNFFQIQKDALDLIITILANINNTDRQTDILRRITGDTLSHLYLCLPFIGWQIKKEQTLLIEDPDIDFGTAEHLYEIIRWADPQVADHLSDFICSNQISLLFFIEDLWSDAFDCFDTEHDYSCVEAIMFVPVDEYKRRSS